MWVGDTTLYRSVEMAELLLKSGADLTIVAHPNGTPLMEQLVLKRLSVAECILKFNPSLVDFAPAAADCPDQELAQHFYTALHYACWQGYLEGVKLLQKYGADCTAVTYDGNTAVGLACHSNWQTCVEYLLSLGCDVNQQDKDGDTALLYATHHGNSIIVDLLLKHGADPSVSNKDGVTPLWNAVFSRSLESVKLLLLKNVDTELCCRGQNWHEVGDLGHIYDVPVTPLFVAIHHEDISVVKALVAAGCYINGEKPNFPIYVAHWAEENKRWLNHVAGNPPSLSWWCKRIIRRTMPVNPKNITEQLSIPSTLKTYLLEI